MKTSRKTQKVKLTLQRVGTVNRTILMQITVKLLSSQFQGEKAHSNPPWDSQPRENGYQTWSVHGVKAVKATSLTLAVETASSVEPVNVSESVVRIVVTPKSRAIRLKRGERSDAQKFGGWNTYIHSQRNQLLLRVETRNLYTSGE